MLVAREGPVLVWSVWAEKRIAEGVVHYSQRVTPIALSELAFAIHHGRVFIESLSLLFSRTCYWY